MLHYISNIDLLIDHYMYKLLFCAPTLLVAGTGVSEDLSAVSETGTNTFGAVIGRLHFFPSALDGSMSKGESARPSNVHRSLVGRLGRDLRATLCMSVKYPLNVSALIGAFLLNAGSAIVQPKLIVSVCCDRNNMSNYSMNL